MNPYTIDVARIEELQMIHNRDELETIFERAKSAIVNGEAVFLTRKGNDSNGQVFDTITTLDDLKSYKTSVFKYL